MYKTVVYTLVNGNISLLNRHPIKNPYAAAKTALPELSA